MGISKVALINAASAVLGEPWGERVDRVFQAFSECRPDRTVEWPIAGAVILAAMLGENPSVTLAHVGGLALRQVTIRPGPGSEPYPAGHEIVLQPDDVSDHVALSPWIGPTAAHTVANLIRAGAQHTAMTSLVCADRVELLHDVNAVSGRVVGATRSPEGWTWITADYGDPQTADASLTSTIKLSAITLINLGVAAWAEHQIEAPIPPAVAIRSSPSDALDRRSVH